MQWTFILTYTLTLVIIIYAFLVLPKGRILWLFIATILLIASFKFYDIENDAYSLLWFRHMPVFLGEITFYFFLTAYGSRFIEIEKTSKKSLPQDKTSHSAALLGVPLMFAHRESLGSFISAQGLPHILTFPIFILLVSLVRLRYGLYVSKYRTPLNWFVLGTTAWILIHVSEFIFESQQLTPVIGSHVEWFELGWFVIGAVIFCKGLASFKKVHGQAHD